MKKIIGALVTVFALAFSGMAYADTFMDSTFGNTVTVSIADGTVVASYQFDADGAFAVTGADGSNTTGTWALDGSNLCLTIGEGTNCNEIEDRNVGDSWDVTDADGSVMTITIVAGR